MSTLKIHRPDQAHTAVQPVDILSFRRPWENRQRQQLDEATLRALSRAKKIRDNSECPCCNSASVVPIELDNAILNRNRLPIPGTSTLVGFHCTICENEWPADRS
ncbi:hypothetical protein Pla110_19610 [Polystyrenella longa]|uniref:Uncharacterized protein n=1 Tax=Polystyrenella longa TaxID=2528007 RepID=A0A518CLZ2_9PLAN|nr:hypothetical protein [Polystyrenella longa]QDU80237.1 hypothetical protein Pla110_19610 [Polystyrenella longa]